MNTTSRVAGVALLALAFSGCEKNEPQPPLSSPRVAPQQAAPAAAPSPVQAPAPAAQASVSVMGLNFPVPAGWTAKPPSNQMRLAEMEAPGPCLLVFSTAGGTVDDNVSRWSGQVRDEKGQPVVPERSTRSVAGLNVTTVQMSGSYAGMGGADPLPNQTLRGAIVETPAGLLFLKMTGPAEAITAQAKAFDAMLDGITKP